MEMTLQCFEASNCLIHSFSSVWPCAAGNVRWTTRSLIGWLAGCTRQSPRWRHKSTACRRSEKGSNVILLINQAAHAEIKKKLSAFTDLYNHCSLVGFAVQLRFIADFDKRSFGTSWQQFPGCWSQWELWVWTGREKRLKWYGVSENEQKRFKETVSFW